MMRILKITLAFILLLASFAHSGEMRRPGTDYTFETSSQFKPQKLDWVNRQEWTHSSTRIYPKIDALSVTPNATADLGSTTYPWGTLYADTAVFSGLTASRIVQTDGTGALASVSDLTSWVAGSGNILVTDDLDGTLSLDTVQDIQTTSSPTFSALTVTSLTDSTATLTGGSLTGLTTLNAATGLVYTTAGTISSKTIGADVQAYDADLAALAGLSSQGMVARTGVASYSERTLTGTANQVNIAFGDGVSGNPTFSTPQDIHTGASPTFANAHVPTGGFMGILSGPGWTFTTGPPYRIASNAASYAWTSEANFAPELKVVNYTAIANGPSIAFQKSRGTLASPSSVVANDYMGLFYFYGGLSGLFYPSGYFGARVDGTPGAGIVPGRLIFAVTDSGGTTTEQMILKANGCLDLFSGTSAGSEVLALGNTGSAPASGSTDSTGLYADDYAAGRSVLGIRTESTSSVITDTDETKFSHKMEIIINGTSYYVMLTTS